jgi:TonB-linked SusC/RagA family outer membrane protein
MGMSKFTFRERKADKRPLLSSILQKVVSVAAIFALSFVLSLQLQAQDATVKGKVVDKMTGEALAGASVSIPSIRLGAITDSDGEFRFKAPAGQHTIKISYVGYESITMKLDLKADETKELTIDLASQSITTDEIVIVGLSGEVDRNKLGNTIGSVKGQDVAKVVSTSPMDALSGRVTGVQVTRNSGTPGAGTYITMRGRKTISGSSEPLYVIDGIIMDNTSLYNGSGEHSFGNRAIDINPQDVESIEILKGASASAIYGSKAANGVVLITTKRGRLSSFDKPASITFSSNYQFDQKTGEVPLQTSFGQRIPYEPGVPGSSDSYGARLADGASTYNHADEPFRTGFSHIQSLTMIGGVPQFDYFLNGTFEDIEGYVIGSALEKYSIRANIGISLLPGVTLQANNNYIQIDNDMPQDGSNVSGILLGALRTPPEFDNTDYLEPDGTQRRFGYYDNPIWTQHNNTYNSEVNRFLSSTTLKWQPLNWISLSGVLGLDRYTMATKERLQVGSAGSPSREGSVGHYRATQFKSNLDIVLNANYNFFDDILATTWSFGSQIIWDDRWSDNSYSSSTLPFFNQIDAGASKDAGSATYRSKTVGYFGQFTGSLYDKYSVTLALRRDGSSTFGTSEQFHYYPKASLSYELSKEGFWEPIKDVVNNARIRASYGEAGSPDLPGVYDTNFLYGTAGWFDPWVTSSNNTRGGFIGIRQGGGAVNALIGAGNDDINPQRSIEREIGIDLSFLNDMFSIEGTFYHADIYDLILATPVPASSGYDYQLKNAGAMWNEGFELSLRAMPINTEVFSWSTVFNWSRNYNLVTQLNVSPEPTGNEYIDITGGFVGATNSAKVGLPLGILHTYGWLRVKEEDIDGNAENGEISQTEKDIYNYKVGDIRRSYWNGEQVIGDDYGYGWAGTPRQDPSLIFKGDPNPDFQWSWRNDFTFFQDFTISMLWDAVLGFDVWNGTKGALYNFGTHGATEDREDPWTFTQGGNEFQVTDYNDPESPVGVDKTEKYWTYENGFLINEPHIEDGSFVKLREIVVEYRWHGLQDWNINSVTFSFAARNLLTITEYTGYDPEVNTFSLAEGRGVDYFTLPQTMSFRFGVSINY